MPFGVFHRDNLRRAGFRTCPRYEYVGQVSEPAAVLQVYLAKLCEQPIQLVWFQRRIDPDGQPFRLERLAQRQYLLGRANDQH